MIAHEIGIVAPPRGTISRPDTGMAVEDFRWVHAAACAVLLRARQGGVRPDILAPLARLAAFALPPRCPGCGTVTGDDHRFCGICWDGLRFLGEPWCAGCARPFEIDRGDSLCGECLAHPPVHDGVRAAVAYGDVARAVVLKLKYGRRLAYADTIARLMERLMPHDADLLVPVPLHRWRLWSRGFNQAQLIAQGISTRSAVPTTHDLLVRIKGGGSLRGRGRKARAASVRNAFVVTAEARARLAGRHVVLVDDVHTSGATANACARALKRGGAARVTMLCWARVLHTDGLEMPEVD
ncbi:ComF family protein [Sphingomonas sp. AX6]|uniref:ComF family protein n=1 Tax=Sphingomonas sp. AX6 TaxID=2653171 RepID=UPI0012F142FB|nr:ComF family protein [Sphingomonas sp. AX6]VXC80117.1 Competence protein F [Sphingomonas sp. AX6]